MDQDLLRRARAALGTTTTRATVEQSLARVAEAAEAALDQRVASQRRLLDQLGDDVDLEVMASEQIWR